MDDLNLTKLIRHLHLNKALRTPSLVITFLGDAVLPRGGEVSSSTIQQLMARLQIEPGAVRTAMSRLCTEGWVSREMRGRNSYFQLSDTILSPFDIASKRFYSPCVPAHDDEQWLLAIAENNNTDSGQSIAPEPEHVIDKRILLFKQLSDSLIRQLQDQQYWVIHGQLRTCPNWLQQRLTPATLAAEFELIMTQFSGLSQQPPTNPLEAMACRCLLIHHWRRLLLRSADLPKVLTPHDWPVERCRAFVGSLYQRLLPASSAWLSAQGEWSPELLAQAQSIEEKRFAM